MTRSMGLVLLLVSLAIVGALVAMQGKSEGPTAAAVTQQEAQALVAASAQNFAQVGEALQAAYAESGTYVGAQLPVGSGVTLAQATATSYCLETSASGTLVHETGPGGSPVAGPC